jgi:hypothetical protein
MSSVMVMPMGVVQAPAGAGQPGQEVVGAATGVGVDQHPPASLFARHAQPDRIRTPAHRRTLSMTTLQHPDSVKPRHIRVSGLTGAVQMALASCPGPPGAAAESAQDAPGLELGVGAFPGRPWPGMCSVGVLLPSGLAAAPNQPRSGT